MPVELRDYQVSTVDAVFEQWQKVQSTLVVLYTGGGKTIIFADMINRAVPRRSLVIAHREELIYQARNKIEASTGVRCEIEMADEYAHTDLFGKTPAVIATVQTLISGGEMKRMHRFKPTDFDIIIIDEAHHATASSYVKILNYFKQNPNLKVCGFTATPMRSDEEALSQVFQTVAAEYDILDGIRNGWLCDITQQMVKVGTLDYSHIKTTAGDLNSAQLAAVMEAEQNIAGVAHPSLEVLFALVPQTLQSVPVPEWSNYLRALGRPPRRTIVFTASVVQAEALCNIFNRAYPGLAEWVCGATNKDARKDMLKRFSRGDTAVMVNCGVLTEGYDNPAVQVIVMARPTKSEALYRQMVGRSTRTLPGVVDGLEPADVRKEAIKGSKKPFCRIIDFVGNAGRHKLISCLDILGGKISGDARQRVMQFAISTGKPILVGREMTKAEIQIEEDRRQKAAERRAQEEARKAHLVAKNQYSLKDIDPFSHKDTIKTSTPVKRGERQLTQKQIHFLLRQNEDPFNMSYGYAVRRIGEIMARFKNKKVNA